MNRYESIRKPLLLSVFLIIQTFRFVSRGLTNEFRFGRIKANWDKTSDWCSLEMLHVIKAVLIRRLVIIFNSSCYRSSPVRSNHNWYSNHGNGSVSKYKSVNLIMWKMYADFISWRSRRTIRTNKRRFIWILTRVSCGHR